MQNRLLSAFIAAALLLVVPRGAEASQLAVGLTWQLFVPAIGPARDLEPTLAPAMFLTFGEEDAAFALAARSGLWRFTGGGDDEFEVSIAPFVAGAEYRRPLAGNTFLVAQLLAGAAWLKVRSPGENSDPPFEEALFTESSLHLAGSGALLLRVGISEIMSLESGLAVDIVYYQEEEEFPGFIGFPLGIIARF